MLEDTVHVVAADIEQVEGRINAPRVLLFFRILREIRHEERLERLRGIFYNIRR